MKILVKLQTVKTVLNTHILELTHDLSRGLIISYLIINRFNGFKKKNKIFLNFLNKINIK